MAEVLFGQCYYLHFDPKMWEAMQPYPPLGTLYAAGYTREQGFSVALFDAMLAASTAEWEDALVRHRPRFAVLFEDNFNYLSKMCLLRMREAAFEMMAMARRHGATVIVSSSDATDHVPEYFQHGAHYVLMGEGEIALAELLESLRRKDDSAGQIAGVAGAAHNGRPALRRKPLRDLDCLPFPAWDLVDIPRYRKIWLERHGYYSVNMITSRGCPYGCNWCAKPIYGQRYNCRSPRNVVEELRWLKQFAKPDHIWFADDIFGLKKGWIKEFADEVCEEGVQTPFKCLLRTDLVTPDAARDLRRTGCRTVWLGAESGSQKILDAMDKGATVEETLRTTQILREAGIEVCYFLQFGYPGEEWEDILHTVQMVRGARPDDIGISVSYPLPGTKFYERVKAQLGSKRNWLDSDDLALMYRGGFPPDFYRRLHRTVHKEHRARRAWQRLWAGHLRGTTLPLLRSITLPLDWLRLQWLRRSRVGTS